MTQQPKWKFVANLGDVNPLDYGGLFVYEDETGIYGFEMERVEPNEDGTIEIHRVLLDRCKEVAGYLVPFIYEENWPHPIASYNEWFADSLEGVAAFIGGNGFELRTDLCSEDGQRRAQAYRAIYDYHGWDNGDSYPLTLTRTEVEERYKDELA